MFAIEHGAKLAVYARRLIEHAVSAIGFDQHAIALLALRLQSQQLFGDRVQTRRRRRGRIVSARTALPTRSERSVRERLPAPDQPVRKRDRWRPSMPSSSSPRNSDYFAIASPGPIRLCVFEAAQIHRRTCHRRALWRSVDRTGRRTRRSPFFILAISWPRFERPGLHSRCPTGTRPLPCGSADATAPAPKG